MKKILTALIVVALLLAAIALVSCEDEGHVHSFKDNTVKATCNTNGYVEHTCECGYYYQDNFTEIDPKGHNYPKDYTVTKEATCVDAGSKERICKNCGNVEVTVVKATGKHTNDRVITLAPTCTEDGKATDTCTVCGKVTTNVKVNKTGHKYGDWVIDIQPSCDTGAYGHQYRDCTVCGVREEQDIPSHTPDSSQTKTTKPTCVSVGYTTYVCSDCGATYIRDYKDATGKHSYDAWHTVEGYSNLERHDCKDCDYYEVREKK